MFVQPAAVAKHFVALSTNGVGVLCFVIDYVQSNLSIFWCHIICSIKKTLCRIFLLFLNSFQGFDIVGWLLGSIVAKALDLQAAGSIPGHGAVE